MNAAPPHAAGDTPAESPLDAAAANGDAQHGTTTARLTADERRSLRRFLIDPAAWSAYGIVTGIGFPVVVLGTALDPVLGGWDRVEPVSRAVTSPQPAVLLVLLGLVHVFGSLAAGQALLARAVDAPIRPRTAIRAAGRYVLREPVGALIAAALQGALIVAVFLVMVMVGFGIGSALSGTSVTAALIIGTGTTILLIAAGCALALGTVPSALAEQRLRNGMTEHVVEAPLARPRPHRRVAVLLGLVGIGAILFLLLQPSSPVVAIVAILLPPVLLIVHLAHLWASLGGAHRVVAVYTGEPPRRTPRITPFLPFVALSAPLLLMALLILLG